MTDLAEADERARVRAKARVGTIIDGRYQLDRILALGGMGAVYLARHLKLKKRVALKLLHPDVEQKVDLVLRFEREALAGAHVDNKHVAAATDFGQLEDGARYLVTEYVRGKTLREILIAYAPLDAVRAARITRQLAVGLGEIHAKGIVHRDIKPRNIMVTDSDFVKIIDFGLAKIEEARVSTIDEPMEGDRITGHGVIFGTVDYLAPEAAFGMDLIDARADLYAVGVIFYEMLTGKHPFDARTDAELFAQQRMKAPPRFAVRAPSVTVAPELERVVMKLLEKDFDERYENAAALIAALDAACPEAKTTPEEPAPSTEPNSIPPPGHAVSSAREDAATASELPPRSSRSSEWPDLGSLPPKDVAKAKAAARVEKSAEISRRGVPWWGWVVGAAAVGGVVIAIGASQADADGSDEPASTATLSSATLNAAPLSSAQSAPSAAAIEAPTPVESASSTATEADGSAAATSSARAPTADPETLRAALKTALGAGKLDEAAAAGIAFLEGDPHALESKEGGDLIRELLVAVARERHPRTDDVWRAAAVTQGERGPDLLYRILETKGRQAWANRATELLRDPEVQRLASPALRIAFALRDEPCPEKLAKIDEAAAIGDARAALALDIVVRGCLKNAKVVDQGLAKLRKRLAAEAVAP